MVPQHIAMVPQHIAMGPSLLEGVGPQSARLGPCRSTGLLGFGHTTPWDWLKERNNCDTHTMEHPSDNTIALTPHLGNLTRSTVQYSAVVCGRWGQLHAGEGKHLQAAWHTPWVEATRSSIPSPTMDGGGPPKPPQG
ncbi:unnamed protein product [Arctogadus glacialis]